MGPIKLKLGPLRIDEKSIAILGALLSLVLVVGMSYIGGKTTFVFLSILVLAACSTWLVLRSRLAGAEDGVESRRLFLILGAGFFLLLTFSILLVRFRTEQFERPEIFFIVVSIMAGMIAIQCVVSQKRMVPLVLTEIISMVIILAWSQNALFPNVLGLDNWVHQWFTSKIIQTGEVPGMFGYSTLPLFHILIGESEMIMDVGYKAVQLTVLLLAQAVILLTLVFLFARRIFQDHRIALLSTLAVSIAVYMIRTSVTPLPTTMGFIFVFLCLYLLVRGQGTRTLLLLVLLAFTIILTHTIAAMCLIIIVAVGIIASRIQWSDAWQQRRFASFTFLLFFFVVTFAWWSFGSDQIQMFRELVQSGFSRDVFLDPEMEVANYVPVGEDIFNMAGQFIYFALSLIGVFFCISQRGNPKASWMGLIGVMLLGIGFVSTTGQLGLLSERWYYYAMMVLAIPMGVTLFIIYRGSLGGKRPIARSKKTVAALVLSGLVVSLAFLSLLTPSSNLDNPFLSPNSNVRLVFIQSEITGAGFLSTQTSANVSSDFDFAPNPSSSVFLWYYEINGLRVKSLDQSLTDNDWRSNGTFQYVRSIVFERPFRVGGWEYSLDYNLKASLLNSDLSKVYNNVGASGYW